MGLEKPGLWEIPDSWQWSKISELGAIVSGGTPSTKEPAFWGNEVNWITPADLSGYSEKFISKGAKSLTQKGLASSPAKLMPKGSVHFSSRAPVGYVVISKEDISTNQGFKSIVPTKGGFNEFLYYYLKGAKRLAEERASGTTFKEISGKAFSELPIPLAPFNEQKRIVSKLEELLSELDKGIESLKTAREQLTVYRQAVLKHAFEGKLTEEWRKKHAHELESAETLLEKIKAKREQRYQEESNHRGKPIKAQKVCAREGKKPTKPGSLKKLPEGWIHSTVNEVAEINPRLNKLVIRDDMYVSFVPMPSVGAEDGTIDVSQERKFDEVKKGFTPFQEKDVLFAKITPCMENGKMAVVPKVKNGYGFGSTEFHVLRPEGGIHPWYLYFFVSRKKFRGKAKQYMTGGVGQKRVPSEYLAEHQIPLCSSSEQIQIVQRLESRFSLIEKLEQVIEDGLKQAEVLRQSLLKKAFEGRLVPQDPNDEPASVLLERIRTEKAKVKKTVRKEKNVAV